MAIRRPSAPQGQPAAQQVFKPRESLNKLTKFFPMMYAGFGVVMVISLGVAFVFQFWLIPVMAAIPMASVIATGMYAEKMKNMRVVLDQQSIRTFAGKQLTLNLPFHTITRLTMKDVNGGNMYELWVKDKAHPLMAEYFEDSDKMLKALSARTSLPWEKVEG